MDGKIVAQIIQAHNRRTHQSRFQKLHPSQRSDAWQRLGCCEHSDCWLSDLVSSARWEELSPCAAQSFFAVAYCLTRPWCKIIFYNIQDRESNITTQKTTLHLRKNKMYVWVKLLVRMSSWWVCCCSHLMFAGSIVQTSCLCSDTTAAATETLLQTNRVMQNLFVSKHIGRWFSIKLLLM